MAVLIVAHTRYQVERFARLNWLLRDDFRFITNARQLDGWGGAVVILLDGWRWQLDAYQIAERIQHDHAGFEIMTMHDNSQIVEEIRNRYSSPFGDMDLAPIPVSAVELLRVALRRRPQLRGKSVIDLLKP